MSVNLQKIKTDAVRPNSTPSTREIDTCKKLMRQYGILAPPVVGDFGDGTKALLYGDCELKAMIELETDHAESIVVTLKDKTEGDKLSLMLMEMKSIPDAVSQGKLIDSLIDSGEYTQTEIASLLSRSVSWVNKRLSLATRLNPTVRDMVSQRLLPPQSAQEIARMPLEVQQDFSSKIIDAKIPKSLVERLVSEYSRADCSGDFKTIILADPARAVGMIPKKPFTEKETAKNESNMAKNPGAIADNGFDGVIESCRASMTTLVELIFQADPSKLLKHERALKQLYSDIDATMKILNRAFEKIGFPQGKAQKYPDFLGENAVVPE